MRTEETNPRAEPPFPIGANVRLKYCDCDELGAVEGFESGRVVVFWPLWNRRGRYMPESLTLAEGI
jgi:hypothetical protein